MRVAITLAFWSILLFKPLRLPTTSHSLSLPTSHFLSMDMNILTATVTDVARALERGSWTSKAIAIKYLDQIAMHNDWLHAVLQVGERDAILRQAEAFDEKRKRGELLGPLHGVPLLIKVACLFRVTKYTG